MDVALLHGAPERLAPGEGERDEEGERHAGDLPLVLPETLRRIAAAPAEQTVVRPVHQGRHGHPVRFARGCGPALAALSGAPGAASVVKAFGLTELVVDDVGCVTDIDTVQDLQQALQILRSRTTPQEALTDA